MQNNNFNLLLDISSLVKNQLAIGNDTENVAISVLKKVRSLINIYNTDKIISFIDSELLSDEELQSEIEIIDSIVSDLGIYVVKTKPENEASLIKRCVELNKSSIIATFDKKLLQLISDDTSVYDLNELEEINLGKLNEKYSIIPEQAPDYVALIGNSGIGVKNNLSVGKRQLEQQLRQHQNIENILSELESEKSRVLTRILKKRVELLESKNNNFIESIPFDISPIRFNKISPNNDLLLKSYKRYGLNNWIIDDNLNGLNLSIINDRISLQSSINDIKSTKGMLINPLSINGEIAAIGVATSDERIFIYPLSNFDKNSEITKEYFANSFKEVLETSNIRKSIVNAKDFCLEMLPFGIEIKSIVFDPIQAFYAVDTGKNSIVDITIDDIYKKITKQPFSKLETKDFFSFGEINLTIEEMDRALRIYGNQCSELFGLTKSFSELLRNHEPKFYKYYAETESKINLIVAKMEFEGIQIDKTVLLDIEKDADSKIIDIERDIASIIGRDIALNSANIKKLLYDELKIVKEKEGGDRSISKDTLLNNGQKNNKIIELIIKLFEQEQIKKEANKFLKFLTGNKKRVNPKFNHLKTKTLRLSAQEPPVQGFAKNGEAKKTRNSVIADKNKRIVSIDYSQFELKILAHLSQDPVLLDAFNRNVDIHTQTASQVFEIPFEKVTDEQRRNAKAINFGLIYGKTEYGLAEDLGISKNEAKSLMSKYFKQFPNVKNYLESLENSASKTGFIRTILGRKISIDGILSNVRSESSSGKRKSKNAPMQGSAAEIMKKAMVDVYELIENNFPETKIINQIHDELIFEVPVSLVKEFCAEAKRTMESVVKLDVPLTVDVEMGPSWGQAKPVLIEKHTCMENNLEIA